jgi:hypothetical protein
MNDEHQQNSMSKKEQEMKFNIDKHVEKLDNDYGIQS